MQNEDHAPPFWRSPSVLVLLVAAAIGGFYLVTEHRAHLYGALPYLFLLACPLMHVFMHRGHRHGGPHEQASSRSTGDEQRRQ